jgi:hyperosmotically inducible periplasmic protein
MRQAFRALPLTALFALLALTLACADNRPDYEGRVNDQLKTANLDDQVKVNWDDNEKTLRLSGEVERAADKTRAEELAQQVVGTSGRVVNEIKVEGEDYARIDDRIEEQLNRMFEDRTEWDFDGRGVSFDSEQGVVTITGTVESEATKQRIGERARAVDGVKDVVNNVDVDPKRRTCRRRLAATTPSGRRKPIAVSLA